MKYYTDDIWKNWGVPFDYQGNGTAPFCKVSLKLFIFYINRIFFIRAMFYSNKTYYLAEYDDIIKQESRKEVGRHVKMGIAMLNRMRNSNDDPCVVIEYIWKKITKINIYCPSEDQTNDSEAKCTYPKGLFC